MREEMPDEKIIDLYWAREEKAIEETHRKYGQFLFRVAYHILCDTQDCEECQNDTYIGVWNTIPPTRPQVFRAFITRIMRYIAINRYKEKSRKKRIPSEMTVSLEELYGYLGGSENVTAEIEAKELGKIISEYVKGLSKQQQYIFVGRFYMVESVDNIAKELGVTPSNVYKAIEKIKRGLKEHLKRNEVYV